MSIDAVTERPAGRLVIAFAMALVIAAGLAVWLWPRSSGPRTEATEAALHDALAIGGPTGWTSAEPVSLLPQADQTGRTESRDGVLVGIERDGDAETGFTTTWTTTVDTLETADTACGALAAWAVRAVGHPAPAEVQISCRAAVDGTFASHGTAAPSGGRKMFYAFADDAAVPSGVVLTASLTFDTTAY